MLNVKAVLLCWPSSGVKLITMASVIIRLSAQYEAENNTDIKMFSEIERKNYSIFDFEVANATSQSVMNPEARKLERVYLYSYAVPALWALCCIAALANGYILLGSLFLNRRKTTVLWITFSLAAADLWASIVLAVGLLINSYLPVVRGITFTNCIGLL